MYYSETFYANIVTAIAGEIIYGDPNDAYDCDQCDTGEIEDSVWLSLRCDFWNAFADHHGYSPEQASQRFADDLVRYFQSSFLTMVKNIADVSSGYCEPARDCGIEIRNPHAELLPILHRIDRPQLRAAALAYAKSSHV